MPQPHDNKKQQKAVARRRDSGGSRKRISTSLDFDDAIYVEHIPGASDSEKLAKVVRAARLAGLTVDDQSSVPIVDEFVSWLSTKRGKSAQDLHKLLLEFLDKR